MPLYKNMRKHLKEIRTYQTFGYVMQGIEENIPLKWNGRIYCEVYG